MRTSGIAIISPSHKKGIHKLLYLLKLRITGYIQLYANFKCAQLWFGSHGQPYNSTSVNNFMRTSVIATAKASHETRSINSFHCNFVLPAIIIHRYVDFQCAQLCVYIRWQHHKQPDKKKESAVSFICGIVIRPKTAYINCFYCNFVLPAVFTAP